MSTSIEQRKSPELLVSAADMVRLAFDSPGRSEEQRKRLASRSRIGLLSTMIRDGRVQTDEDISSAIDLFLDGATSNKVNLLTTGNENRRALTIGEVGVMYTVRSELEYSEVDASLGTIAEVYANGDYDMSTEGIDNLIEDMSRAPLEVNSKRSGKRLRLAVPQMHDPALQIDTAMTTALAELGDMQEQNPSLAAETPYFD